MYVLDKTKNKISSLIIAGLVISTLRTILINTESLCNNLLFNNFIKAKKKLIDLGFARYLDENELAGSLVGTPLYMVRFKCN